MEGRRRFVSGRSVLVRTGLALAALTTLLCQLPVLGQDVSRIERIARFYRDRDGFMGTVAVAKEGRTVFDRSYGYADVERNIPFTEPTRFPIGSLSKQFTAAAILLLQQEGKLRTSDLVGRFYTGAPSAWAHITLRDLLTQTSGIPDFDFAEAVRRGPQSPTSLIQRVVGQPLKFEPGTAFDYSNANYVLLALVVESASGEPYCRFLRERIFEPLKLTQTGCDWRSGAIPNSALGYRPSAKGFAPAENDDLANLSGAGSLYSTATDLIRWTTALHGGKVLNQASLKEMTTPFLDGYAYGLEIDGEDRIGHNGAVDGFYSAVDYLPKAKTVVVVLSNVNSDGNQISPGSFAMEVEIMKSVIDKSAILASEGKELPLSSDVLRPYIGRYKASDSQNPASFTVGLDGDHLFFQLDGSGNGPIQLRAESQAEFYVVDDEVEVDFSANGSATLIDYSGHSATPFVRTSHPK
jgi:CubicO group peptidase (beta-lactamase class C family)